MSYRPDNEVRRWCDEASPEQVRAELKRAVRIADSVLPAGDDFPEPHMEAPAPAEPCTHFGMDESPIAAAGRFWVVYLALALFVVAGAVYLFRR